MTEAFIGGPVRIMGAANEPAQPYMIAPLMEKLLVDYAVKENMVTKLAQFILPLRVSIVY